MHHEGKSPVQRMLDYQNRAEELRVLSERMKPGTRDVLFNVAESYDQLAEKTRLEILLADSAEPYPGMPESTR